MLIDDVYALKCEATVRSRMEDLKTLALSVLVREAASRLGFANVKPQQMEAILAFCQGKDVFVSFPTGFGKTLIFAVLLSLFNTIRRSLVNASLRSRTRRHLLNFLLKVQDQPFPDILGFTRLPKQWNPFPSIQQALLHTQQA